MYAICLALITSICKNIKQNNNNNNNNNTNNNNNENKMNENEKYKIPKYMIKLVMNVM